MHSAKDALSYTNVHVRGVWSGRNCCNPLVGYSSSIRAMVGGQDTCGYVLVIATVVTTPPIVIIPTDCAYRGNFVLSMFALHPLGVNTCFVRSEMQLVAFNGHFIRNCLLVIRYNGSLTAYHYIRDLKVL